MLADHGEASHSNLWRITAQPRHPAQLWRLPGFPPGIACCDVARARRRFFPVGVLGELAEGCGMNIMQVSDSFERMVPACLSVSRIRLPDRPI